MCLARVLLRIWLALLDANEMLLCWCGDLNFSVRHSFVVLDFAPCCLMAMLSSIHS